MAEQPTPGPWEYLESADGRKVPLYIVRFDKHGQYKDDGSLHSLLSEARDYTDIYVFSHGWNNEWSDALARYRGFFKGYTGMRKQHGLPMPDGYRPLLVGVFWPSAALAFGESGVGPKARGLDQQAAMQDQAQYEREVAEVADSFDTDAQRAEFLALAGQPGLSESQARRLAELAVGVLQDTEAEHESGGPLDAEGLLRSWREASDELRPDQGPVLAGMAQPAGVMGRLPSFLDPRWPIRLLSVAIMKDRAGVVGAQGVGPVLEALLRGSSARVHLVGHSFGSKVILAALCSIASLPRKVRSALLLQGAISHLCFADRVPKKNYPGGYRAALERIEQPILATYSEHDSPLYRLFHHALKRDADVGELMKRRKAPKEPSRYAALGGYGPRHAGERLIPIQAAGRPYTLDPSVRVYGLDGAGGRIPGHSDISNEYTWWALYSLVVGGVG